MAINEKYTLISSCVPEYENSKGKDGRIIPVIKNNFKAGGIKLKYRVQKIESSHKSILWGLFNIPYSQIVDEKELVFLRPFKRNIGKSSKDVPKHMWGPPDSPFSTVWICLGEDDYTDWDKYYSFATLSEVKDHRIIPHCNDKDKQFVLPGEKDVIRPSTISLIFWTLLEGIKDTFKKSKV